VLRGLGYLFFELRFNLLKIEALFFELRSDSVKIEVHVGVSGS
jgi:hypothetical protein